MLLGILTQATELLLHPTGKLSLADHCIVTSTNQPAGKQGYNHSCKYACGCWWLDALYWLQFLWQACVLQKHSVHWSNKLGTETAL